MTHPLVDQLRFTRWDWLRGLRGVPPDDAPRHFGPMNCLSWIIGHLAWHEQSSLLQRPRDIILIPALKEMYAYDALMSTPPLSGMLRAWRLVTRPAGAYLDGLTTPELKRQLPLQGRSVGQSVGSAIRRVTYHYWYHIGEIQSIRQMLRHKRLPGYVGDLEAQAPYRPK